MKRAVLYLRVSTLDQTTAPGMGSDTLFACYNRRVRDRASVERPSGRPAPGHTFISNISCVVTAE